MILEFTKMNGAGNDFIAVDNRSLKIQLAPRQISLLCDRNRGIGADGVMVLIPCPSGKADWAWDFYNSDGTRAAMCGNGARCFARFIQKLTGAKDKITFETGAGIISATFQGERVTVNLTVPKDLRLNETVILKGGATPIHSLNTGVEHAIIFVDDADKEMVRQTGAEVRHHAHFAPRGTNVNFVQLLGANCIRVRTYERGVENETLACGTGVTASALISASLKNFTSPVQIHVLGGDVLEVSFTRSGDEFSDVRLTGLASFVFEGKIEV